MRIVIASISAFVALTSGSSVCDFNQTNYFDGDYSMVENHVFTSLKRGPKFINFKTVEDDLKISFEYFSPFLRIPVKNRKTSDESLQGILNINTGALVLSAIAVFAGMSVSAAINFIGDAWTNPSPKKKTYREHIGLQGEMILDAMSKLESTFSKHDIDLNACLQRSICVLAKNAKRSLASGTGSSVEKIIDGVTKSEWILRKLAGTAIRDAMETGQSHQNCGEKYSSCITKNWNLQNILHHLMAS